MGEMVQLLRALTSSIESEFSSKHSQGGSQSSVTPVLGDLMPSSDLHGHHMRSGTQTYTQTQ